MTSRFMASRFSNSPNFHVYYGQGDGFTAWGVIINSPQHARNTDGIDPANSTNVTITRCFIHVGDDQVAIKAGDGGPSSHMTISHDHFYTGHGISTGSETNSGVSEIRVFDLSIDGADNGIRIKSNSSRGGLVHDVIYEDVCIRDTKNPIFMDSNYSFYGKERDKLPEFRDVTLHNVRSKAEARLRCMDMTLTHRLEMHLNGVSVDGREAVSFRGLHADLTLALAG